MMYLQGMIRVRVMVRVRVRVRARVRVLGWIQRKWQRSEVRSVILTCIAPAKSREDRERVMGVIYVRLG